MKRYDLDGLRLRVRDDRVQYVYLVIDGVLRLLDPLIEKHGLFADWGQTWTIEGSRSLALEYGDPISATGTGLFSRDTKVMLQINSGPYRWIRDPQTFNRFAFNGGSIHSADPGHAEGSRILWQPWGDGDLSLLDGKVQLMDEGRLRHVVEYDTYRDLFGARGAVEMYPVNGELGPAIDRSVRLIKAPDREQVWLLDGATRRRIGDANAFEYYGFSRGVVHSMPYGELVEYAEGRPINWPTGNFALYAERQAVPSGDESGW